MLHLIDRVYIQYAEAKPEPKDPILNPEYYIRIIDRGLAGMHDVNTADKNLLNFKEYQNALDHFGGSQNFLNFLLGKTNSEEAKKVVIYADEVAALQLLISFWKGFFPKITAKGAWNLYMIYRDFEKLKPNDAANYIAFDRDCRRLVKADFFEIYWGFKYEKFESLFNFTPAMELSDAQKEMVGLEYLMIKYILNREGNHAKLFEKTKHFYKKMLMHEICGLKDLSKEYLYNILLEENLLVNDVLLSEKAMIDIIKDNERFKPILDDEIKYSIGSYYYIKNKYNVIKLVSDLAKAEYLILGMMGINQQKKDIAFCSYIIDNHQEPEVTDILDDQLLYTSKYRIFRELAKKGRYNQYLVLSFLKTFEKDKERLIEFME